MQDKQTKDRFLTIRLPKDIEQSIRQIAAQQTRTITAQILHYLKAGIEKDSKP
jgi:hypothetical protein